MDLTEFASLSLSELAAEIAAMQATFTPATAGTSRDAAGDFSPLDRAVAGTLILETHT